MNKIEQIKAEIERLIEVNKTKNGFPAGTICAARIEAYEVLLERIDTLDEPSGDLVKEVQRYYFDNFDYITSDQPTLSILTNIARHFANWQKEQMMKDAVEGEVYLYESYKRTATAILVDVPKEELGDKVKIIIIKED